MQVSLYICIKKKDTRYTAKIPNIKNIQSEIIDARYHRIIHSFIQ